MSISRRVALVPALLAAAACGGRPPLAQTPAPAAPSFIEVSGTPAPGGPSFIEVSGSAAVTVPPDLVRVSFAVETQAAQADDASSANATLMNAVVGTLKESAIRGVRVETFGYTLRPDYAVSQAPRTRVIEGYTALNNVRATAGDITAAGRLVDIAIQAGANRVSSLVFDAADAEAARAEALRLAVRRATAQAEVMAEALGRELGSPLEVRGGAELPFPRAQGPVAFRAAEAVDTPIEAGDLTVSASVTIRFALGGTLEGR